MRCILQLALACGVFALSPGASAADAVLLPHVVAIDPEDVDVAAGLHRVVREVLETDDFVVLEPEDVREVLGEALDVCPPAQRTGCVSVALMGIPVRVGVVVRVERRVEGKVVVVDLVHQGETEPIRSLVLPLVFGEERRIAVQVVLAALDVFEQVGASSPPMVEAARRMAYGPALIHSGPVVVSEEEDLDEEDPLEADLDEEDPFAEEEELERPPRRALDAEVDVMLGRLDDEGVPASDELPPRLFAGARGSYEAREGEAGAWYKRHAPHAGRFIVELRGGLAYGDVKRRLLTMGALDDQQQLTAVLWEEGPVQGLGGLFELGLGYAPVTFLEIGVVGGMRFVRDEIAIGYMNEGQTPTFGDLTAFDVVRPYVQPRVRAYPVHLGIAKPFVVVGGRFEFVKAWRFNTGTAQPFPRPPGGVLYGIVSGLGLVVDPVPRLGIVIESTLTYNLGTLSNVRLAGTLVGDPPLPPAGKGWSLDVVVGLQLRL
jgi:hypothetical protein